jgi:hypothetical protein
MCKALALTLSALLGACAGTATDVEYAGTVTVSSPELVAIGEPDVFVVADADQPVFYTDNVYWLYRDGYWYRSPRYDRGWVRWESPPVRLRHISQPTAYVHYRSRAQTSYNQSRDRYEPRARDQVRPQPQDRSQSPQLPQPAQPPIPNPRPPQQQPPLTPATPGGPDHHNVAPDDHDRGHDRNLTPDQRDRDRAVPPDDRGTPDNRGNDRDDRGNVRDDRGRVRDDRNAAPPDRDRTTPPDERGRGDKADQDRDDTRGKADRDKAKAKKDKRDRDRDR